MNSPIKIPLVECSIQLNFHGDARIDAVRGLFQQEVRGSFPLLLVPNALHDTPLSLQPYQFSNSTRTKSLNIAINSFCYTTNEYPGGISTAKIFSHIGKSLKRLSSQIISPRLASGMSIDSWPLITRGTFLSTFRLSACGNLRNLRNFYRAHR